MRLHLSLLALVKATASFAPSLISSTQFIVNRFSKRHHLLQTKNVGHLSAPYFGSSLDATPSPDSFDDIDSATVAPLLKIAQAHFTSQALATVVKLAIPDILASSDVDMTVSEISLQLPDKLNEEALMRVMRLLSTIGIFTEKVRNDDRVEFGLTASGNLLRNSNSSNSGTLSDFILHYSEKSMWNAWAELPDYIAGKTSAPPFDVANKGMNIVQHYQENTKSSQHRNGVARFVSSNEISSVVNGFDWSTLNNKTVVDIGGGYGNLMGGIKDSYPEVNCVCLDLPSVIDDNDYLRLEGVSMVAGDMFIPTTIPKCDAILAKHVLCDWSDNDVVQALKSFNLVLPEDGKVIIADAVLLDGEAAMNTPQVQGFMDVMLLLVGGRMERSTCQWRRLAKEAGFDIEVTKSTNSLALNITVLTKT